MLLLEFLPHGCFLGLVSVLELETNITENILLVETQLLERVVVGLLWHLVLHLCKLLHVNLEVCLDCIRFGVLLIRVLLE